MMLTVTNAVTKQCIGVNINIILVCERDAGNPLEVKLITSLNTGKGLQTYPIVETPEEVAEMIRAIHRGALTLAKTVLSS